MRSYILKRAGQALLVLWAAYTLSFLLLSNLPGDAIRNRINAPDSLITPQAAKTLLNYYGVNRPLWEQYLRGLRGVFTGDLGFSIDDGSSVWHLIVLNLPSTLKLTGAGLLFGVLISATVGLLINYARWGWLRDLFGSLPALFTSVPIFVIGIVVLKYFAFTLHLIPPVDNGSLTALIAPGATIGTVISGPLSQVFANSIRSTRRQPYVHVMQAKGAGERYIFRKDVLRNSSLPVLTLLGLVVGELIASSVVTETVYARKGIGQLVVNAVNTQDLPVVQGVVLLTTTVFVIVNFVVDVIYPFVDPRILLDASTERVTGRRRADVGTPAADVTETTGRRLPVEVAMP